LCAALVAVLLDANKVVVHIGQRGTGEIYFAAMARDVGGGIVGMASHNPRDYNGMKFVREGARPISGDSGLFEIRRLAEQNRFAPRPRRGEQRGVDSRKRYVQH